MKIFSIFEQHTPEERDRVLFTESEITIGPLESSPRSPELESVKGISKNYIDIARFASSTEQSFLDLCTWLTTLFGDCINRDTTWDMVLIPLAAHRPTSCDYYPFVGFRENYSDRWRNMMDGGSLEYRDKWFHFLINHESDMTVSQVISIVNLPPLIAPGGFSACRRKPWRWAIWTVPSRRSHASKERFSACSLRPTKHLMLLN